LGVSKIPRPARIRCNTCVRKTLAAKTMIASNKVDCKTYLFFCSRDETYDRVVAASPRFREKGGFQPSYFQALKQRAASDPNKQFVASSLPKNRAANRMHYSGKGMNRLSAFVIPEASRPKNLSLTGILITCCSNPRWKSNSRACGHGPFPGQTSVKSGEHVSGLPLATVARSGFAAVS
jgi:hypothetical protein